MPTLYPYIRVSTKEQEKGYSPDAQVELAQGFAAKVLQEQPDLALAEPIEDLGHSAFKVMIFKRDKFRDLMGKLQPGDAVFFAYADRACRDVCDLLMLDRWATKHGVTLYFGNIPYTPDPMLRTILLCNFGICAQMESYHKSVRRKEYNAIKKAKGITVGECPKPGTKRVDPKGFRYDRIDPAQLTEFAWIAQQLEGTGPIQETRQKVAALGHKSKAKGADPLSLDEARIILEYRHCERLGKPFKLSTFHDWLWTRWRVQHAYAMHRGLLEAGEDNERINAVLTMVEQERIKRWPVPKRR
jgi:DNA invertase Pin-like site-specific DNA recombinase